MGAWMCCTSPLQNGLEPFRFDYLSSCCSSCARWDVHGQAVYRLLQTCQEARARLRRSLICCLRSPHPKASTFAAAAELALMLSHPRFARFMAVCVPHQVTNILNWEPPLGEKGVEEP